LPDRINQRIADYEPAHQATLSQLRDLVHRVAAETSGCGSVVEALKWNQISFLTEKPKSGTTLRFDKNRADTISLYVNCNSTLIADFKQHYPDKFEFIGAREVVLPANLDAVQSELEHMIAIALTYHQNKSTAS